MRTTGKKVVDKLQVKSKKFFIKIRLKAAQNWTFFFKQIAYGKIVSTIRCFFCVYALNFAEILHLTTKRKQFFLSNSFLYKNKTFF